MNSGTDAKNAMIMEDSICVKVVLTTPQNINDFLIFCESKNNNYKMEQISSGKLLYKERLFPEESQLRKLMNSATDKNGECPENFKCNICHQIVFDP
jgi:hypothetical protein